MPEDEKAKAEKEAGVPSALSKIITTGFKAIHLIYFFTAGEDEVKCWQIRKGAKAPQAAGTIHTVKLTRVGARDRNSIRKACCGSHAGIVQNIA